MTLRASAAEHLTDVKERLLVGAQSRRVRRLDCMGSLLVLGLGAHEVIAADLDGNKETILHVPDLLFLHRSRLRWLRRTGSTDEAEALGEGGRLRCTSGCDRS
jgi:hypothetical protein